MAHHVRRQAATTRGTVIAIDLGGTRLKAGVVDAHGVVSGFSATVLGNRPALDAILAAAADLQQRQPAVGAGLAVPGLVDAGRLVALAGKLPGLEGVDLGALLAQRLGIPAVVANDAQAYALGEATYGAARGYHRAVVVTIGTGVGVAVVEDGRALGAGPHGGGIFGGHIPIAATSDHPDSNGRRGTIEALCAAPRLLDVAVGSTTTVEDVLDGARAGDAGPTEAVERWRAHLVTALVALAHAHGPEVVVVGGGPLSGDGMLLDGVDAAVNMRLYRGYSVRVVRAELGDTAALVGIAEMAQRSVGRGN